MNNQYCSVCNSEEGKTRLVGNYTVVLKSAIIQGEELHLCQSCYMHHHKQIQNKINDVMKASSKNRLRNFIKNIFSLLLLMVALSLTVQAQGIPGLPSFPSDPQEAPIDGGLGLLAAAGGAYAIKKLRNKNK